jgi:hypothetical protein
MEPGYPAFLLQKILLISTKREQTSLSLSSWQVKSTSFSAAEAWLYSTMDTPVHPHFKAVLHRACVPVAYECAICPCPNPTTATQAPDYHQIPNRGVLPVYALSICAICLNGLRSCKGCRQDHPKVVVSNERSEVGFLLPIMVAWVSHLLPRLTCASLYSTQCLSRRCRQLTIWLC